MKCNACTAPCCKDVVYLTPREFRYFLAKKNPLISRRLVASASLKPARISKAPGRMDYKHRPLACIRYPLAVRHLENAVLFVLHFKCLQVSTLPTGPAPVSGEKLEAIGISKEEYSHMMVANLLLDAEIGRVWKSFTLKERNKMRRFEARRKEATPATEVIMDVLSTGNYVQVVQACETLLETQPNLSYDKILQNPPAFFSHDTI